MSTNDDFMLALELQKEFDREFEDDDDDEDIFVKETSKPSKYRRKVNGVDLDATSNLVHPQWETLDPTPDVFSLFNAFDTKFFQDRLKCVTLEWSKRMYSCAGICYSRRNRLGMSITIRLSEPLLKLRSRKDLIETLLHEMIHAYLSILKIRESNGGHGPNFRKIMDGINKVAGTNITVYHTFHDEVEMYKTHWWRCNGMCQNRKPFLGYVKRTCNRAPGPNDIWWDQHARSCGGSFMKIREPEKRPIKGKNKENFKKPVNDIRKFIDAKQTPKFNTGTKPNGGGTLVINQPPTKTAQITSTSTPTKSNQIKTFGNLHNVVGLKDIDNERSPTKSNKTATSSGQIEGVGHVLGANEISRIASTKPPDKDEEKRRNEIRDIWSKKFSQPATSVSSGSQENKDDSGPSTSKRPKLADNDSTEIPEVWTAVDDDIMWKEDNVAVIDISSDEESDSPKPDEPPQSKALSQIKQTQEERQKQIKQEILDSDSEDDIDFLDDEYDDAIVDVTLSDTSLIDDLFGEDTLLKDFKNNNGAYGTNSRYHKDPKNDIVQCPVCQENIQREFTSSHLDGCIGISIKIDPFPSSSKPKPAAQKRKRNIPTSTSSEESDKAPIASVLRNLGYEDSDIRNALDTETEPTPNRREGLLDTSLRACPVCANYVEVDKINEHLDICLGF